MWFPSICEIMHHHQSITRYVDTNVRCNYLDNYRFMVLVNAKDCHHQAEPLF